MNASHRYISPPSTYASQGVNGNHLPSQLRLDPRDNLESHRFQREPINLPPINVWFHDLAQPSPPPPQPVQHQLRPFHSCRCQPLGPLTRPHSAPARYEPYSLRRPSLRKKSYDFFDRRDAEPHSYHLGVKRIHSSLELSVDDHEKYTCNIGHESRTSACRTGRSTNFVDVATPRPYIIETIVPNSLKHDACPCGRCPLPQRQYSDSGEKYLSAPELPSRRGSVEIDTKYPSSHNRLRPSPSRKTQSQARSIQKIDFSGSSRDCTPVVYRPDRTGGKEDEPVDGDESSSSLTVNHNPVSKTEEWLTYCVDLGKEDPSLTNIFRCLYPSKKGPCTFERKKSTVKRHVLGVHLKKRPHVCTFCRQDPHKGLKAFGQMQGLRIHINAMHKDVGSWEPFICGHCSKEFADASQRNKHYKTQHPAVKIKPRKKIAT